MVEARPLTPPEAAEFRLEKINGNFAGKDFISMEQLTRADLEKIFSYIPMMEHACLNSKRLNLLDGVVIGGIASSYQGVRIEKICGELGLKFIAPLWGFSPEDVWGDLLREGFEVVMTRIACDGLGSEWIGRVISDENFAELRRLAKKYKFRIDFEGGEAETSVLWMPEFRKRIKIDFDVESDGKYRHLMTGVVVR